ncbi:MAG: class B sortase [Oscillospiraceae bacterium]|nr:class B sortase [Oscillospiraceae bacterium]
MKKRRTYLIIAIACLVVAVAAVVVILFMTGVFGGTEPESPPLISVSGEKTSEEPVETDDSENGDEEGETSPYASSIDFQALQDRNKDIYAWLDIPGTSISYAVVQSDIEDEYYLRRDLDGNYAVAGSIFSQAGYNSKDMADHVTVFYGHHMTNGTMFGNLQQIYSNAESFAEHNRIIVYLPDRELDYTVCAAVPFDNRHIMANFDFNDEDSFNEFWDMVTSNTELTAQFDRNIDVEYGDHLLVLSTCLDGNNTRRYLVIAKLDEDEARELDEEAEVPEESETAEAEEAEG